MGYDSLRIELRYRHIWQTKWAAAANAEAQDPASTSASNPPVSSSANGGQANSSRGRRSTSLNRNVHYETEPDPGVDSPVGNKPPMNNGGAGGQPANYGQQGAQQNNNRGRHKSYRHYRYFFLIRGFFFSRPF